VVRNVSVVFIPRGMSARELLKLKCFGYLLVSTADCQGGKRVDDNKAYIRGKFAMVVGDEELAKRLDVGHMEWEGALDFLGWLLSRQYGGFEGAQAYKHRYIDQHGKTE